jgi:hypothetical protein
MLANEICMSLTAVCVKHVYVISKNLLIAFSKENINFYWFGIFQRKWESRKEKKTLMAFFRQNN